MEEGPEPQELMEHVDHNLESKEEGRHGSKKEGNKHLRAAVTAAILAVLAALGSLLSGHAANEAILLQSQASDQWSYFQAKSIKSHLYENDRTLIEAFAQIAGNKSGGDELVKTKLESKIADFEKQKKEVEDKARDLEKESSHEFSEHQLYSLAVASFQIGIVIASVSILVDAGALYACSIVGGAAGIVLLVMGYTLPMTK